MALLVANRWFYMKTIEWRVGVTAAAYSKVVESSLGRSGFTRSPDPFVELSIPKGTTNILQEINTGTKLKGFIDVTDWNAITDLLYTIDVDNDVGGVQTAIEANNTRTIIDYFALIGVLIQLVNATDTRTTPSAAFSFTNAVIGVVPYLLEKPNDPVRITFYADSVTLTVA